MNEIIPFPAPPREISKIEFLDLKQKANEIEVHAWDVAREALGELGFEEYLEPEDISDWLYDHGGIRELARKLRLPFLGSGQDRFVFGLGDFVVKLAYFQRESNEQEWITWKNLPPEKQIWLAKPYVLSNEDSVIIMERLNPLKRETPGAIELIAAIEEQEPWLEKIVLDLSWYNWGYRPDSDVPVVLDYGY